MRVALGQLRPQAGDVAANVGTVVEVLDADPDVDLVVLPELYLSGYALGQASSLAVPVRSDAIDAIRDAARRHRTAVIVGFAERVSDTVLANALACIDESGDVVATYRKTNLFGAAERAVFTPGTDLVVARLAGHDVGVLNCFDVEFPEPARALAVHGAELLVTAAANMRPYGPDHALAVRARALDNRLPHVYVNRTGTEGEHRFVGESCVTDATGAISHVLGADAEVAVVDLPSRLRASTDIDYLRQLPQTVRVERARPPAELSFNSIQLTTGERSSQ